MSARALKRRRLNAANITADTDDVTPPQTRSTEQTPQDVLREGNERVSRPQTRTSPALERIPTPSKSSRPQIKVGQDAVASEAQSSPAPRTAMDIWREAKSKSQGYRRRMMKDKPKEKSVLDVYDDFEGAHPAPGPSERGAKRAARGRRGAGRGSGSGRGSGRGRKTNGQASEKGLGVVDGEVLEKRKKTFEDEIRDLEASAKKQAEQEEQDAGDEDDDGDEIVVERGTERRSSSRKSKPSKRMELSVNGHAAASGVEKSATKPLDRRKTKAVVLSEDEVDSLQNEEADYEVPCMAQDVEMAEDVDVPNVMAPVSTPRTDKTYPANTENFFRAGLSNTYGTAEKTKLPASKLSSAPFPSSEDLQFIQRIVLEKTTGKRPIPLVNLDAEYAKVSAMINQTVTAGESNSMLLIGARGCGKSALVNQVIREQTAQHPEDFHTVRLSGFLHTDDKIALREIWRQLGREMNLEDDTAMKNYADILTSLLALLSHPAETGRDQEGHVTKSVIFVIDEFELFAHHPRQTLLYNLFDIAQSRKAPIAVLGLTTKIDVAESLEKRVKSRFSHRYVHIGLPKSFRLYEETCKTAISIAASELTETEKAQLHVPTGISSKLHQTSSERGPESKQPTASLTQWNHLVDHIFALESVQSHLRRLYYTTKSVSQFITSISYSIITMPLGDPPSSPASLLPHFKSSFSPSLAPPDSKLDLLPSLSTLQLALLICAARLTAIHDADTVSFALAYDEYKTLASKVKLQASASGAIAQGAGSRVWGRGVARNAWEALVECGLVLLDGRAGGAGRVDVGLEEIGGSGVELGVWGRWCREI